MPLNFIPSNQISKKANFLFDKEKVKLLELFPNADIQHVGSTSIPGSLTKGDLDINIRVSKLDFNTTVNSLKQTYEVNQPENWTKTFASFKDDNMEIPLGVQLTVKNSQYDDFYKLRDLLINDSVLLKEYNEMKLKFHDKNIDDYRKEKSEFFERLRKLTK